MKDKIIKITQDLEQGAITEDKARSLLLKLLGASGSSDFELQRLLEWLQEEPRTHANTKFTAGMTRNVAREFEYLLKHSR